MFWGQKAVTRVVMTGNVACFVNDVDDVSTQKKDKRRRMAMCPKMELNTIFEFHFPLGFKIFVKNEDFKFQVKYNVKIS